MEVQNKKLGTLELIQIPAGQSAVIHSIEGGWHIRQRLNQMGLHTGDPIRVKQASSFHGPMLIEIHGSQVALGCGMARKILVQKKSEEGHD